LIRMPSLSYGRSKTGRVEVARLGGRHLGRLRRARRDEVERIAGRAARHGLEKIVEQHVLVGETMIARQVLPGIETEHRPRRCRIGHHHLHGIGARAFIEERVVADQRQRDEAVHPALVDLREHAEEMVHRVPRHVGARRDKGSEVKGLVGQQRTGETGNVVRHREIGIYGARGVLLSSGKARVEISLAVEQTGDRTAARRPVGPEIMVEAAVFLIDHDDMVDLFAQRRGIRRGRRRDCPADRPRCCERRAAERGGAKQPPPAQPMDCHRAPRLPRLVGRAGNIRKSRRSLMTAPRPRSPMPAGRV
jgi:hypothetical protein